MNTYRKILSYILLTLYVISGAHGAVTHCHDNSHVHVEHSHSHEGHDNEEEISFLHSVTHEIIHSFAHFIEHTANDHECCDIELMVKVDTVKTGSTPNAALVTIRNPKSKFLSNQNRYKSYYIADYYQEIFLSLSSMRGPPSVV